MYSYPGSVKYNPLPLEGSEPTQQVQDQTRGEPPFYVKLDDLNNAFCEMGVQFDKAALLACLEKMGGIYSYSDVVFGVGKYSGETVVSIAQKDVGYLRWVVSQAGYGIQYPRVWRAASLLLGIKV